MAEKNSNPTLTDVLRAAIIERDLPLLTLQQETGVPRASIMRFLRGERSLRLDIAEKLATYLELELAPARRRKEKGK